MNPSSRSFVGVGMWSLVVVAGCSSSSKSSAPLRPEPVTASLGAGGAGAGSGAGLGGSSTAAGGGTSAGGATGVGGSAKSGFTCSIDGCSVGAGGSTSNGGSTSGKGGSTGVGGSGMEIPDGPPGSVGSKCMGMSCDPGLQCSSSQYCQPVLSAPPGEVVQAVPPPDSPGVPSFSPIVLFMNGAFTGVNFKVEAFTTGATMDYSSLVDVTKLSTAKMADIYVLAPRQPYPLGSSVVVTISGSVTGVLVFDIAHKSPAAPIGALGFEAPGAPVAPGSPFDKLPSGWIGFGDTSVTQAPFTTTSAMGGPGEVVMPTEGKTYAAFSSGTAVGGSAVGATSSMLQSGPLDAAFKTFSFDYDLHSAEFNAYCGSQYDDTFLVVIAGPKGSVAKVVDSVDLVCDSLMASASSPGMLHTETLTGTLEDVGMFGSGRRTISIPTDVGSPAVLAFVVTDVGDSSFTTLVTVDNIVTK